MFYGHRAGQLADPFGYSGRFPHPIENLSAQRYSAGLMQCLITRSRRKGGLEVRKGFHTVTPLFRGGECAEPDRVPAEDVSAEETLRSGPGL